MHELRVHLTSMHYICSLNPLSSHLKRYSTYSEIQVAWQQPTFAIDGRCPNVSAVHVLLSRFYPDFYLDFIQILSWFYPDFLKTHLVQILSRFYPNFRKHLDKIWMKCFFQLHPDFKDWFETNVPSLNNGLSHSKRDICFESVCI